MKSPLLINKIFICIYLLCSLLGCRESSRNQATPAKEHDHGSEGEGATYLEGKGISLMKETEQSLGVEIVDLTEQNIQSKIHLTAQVYRSASEKTKKMGGEQQGNAYATALISNDLSTRLKDQTKVSFLNPRKNNLFHVGTLWKIITAQASGLENTELLLEFPDPEKSMTIGDFLEIDLIPDDSPSKKLVIPHSARLTTSNGTFAFVKNGDFLLRTEIKTGIENEEWIEIVEGLYEGDQVAVKPVEALYMIELRATKGGGHCH